MHKLLINKYLIIWKRKDDSYYYRIVIGTYQRYFIGFENSYHHKVVMIIPVSFIVERPGLKKRLYKKVISYLEKRL